MYTYLASLASAVKMSQVKSFVRWCADKWGGKCDDFVRLYLNVVNDERVTYLTYDEELIAFNFAPDSE